MIFPSPHLKLNQGADIKAETEKLSQFNKPNMMPSNLEYFMDWGGIW